MLEDSKRFSLREEHYLYCIRCGLCLYTCPTYRLSLREPESPRGRVALVSKAMQNELELSPKLADYVDGCLGCLACDEVCPAGISPSTLCLDARHLMRHELPGGLLRRLILHNFPSKPSHVEMLMLPLLLYQRLGLSKLIDAFRLSRLLPELVQDLECLASSLPPRSLQQRLPTLTPAKGDKRYRVALFVGCFQRTIFAETSRASVRVLAENGCEVIIPKDIRCCGMPARGEGDLSTARDLARYNIRVIERLQRIDAVITDCATCGSALKGYGSLLDADPKFNNRAAAFSRRVYDVSEFLVQIGLKEPCRKINCRVTYHDPCHLARAQGIRAQPRDLIEVTGAQLVEMRESDWCCGSAGIHLFTHHEISTKLLERKMINVIDTGAEVVATGCPGCQLQLILGSKRSDAPIQILHPVQLLDSVYGEKSADEPPD